MTLLERALSLLSDDKKKAPMAAKTGRKIIKDRPKQIDRQLRQALGKKKKKKKIAVPAGK